MYGDLEKYDTALYYLNTAIRADSADPAAFNSLGITYMNMGDTARAISFQRRAVALDEKNSRYAANLGSVLLSMKKYGEIPPLLEPVLKHDSANPKVYYLIGMALLEGAELWRQPQGRDARGAADRDDLMLPVGKQLVGHRIGTVGGFVHAIQISLAGAGERQAPVVPDK